MKLPHRRLGALLLGAWLIAQGLLHFVPALSFQGIANVLALLALAAGIFVLLDR
jgi:hypothetical protein